MSCLMLLNGWQAGRGDCLSVALFFLAGGMKTDLPGQFWKLLFQTLAGRLENQVATRAAHYTAQHQQIADLVEIGVMSDVVAQVDADGFINLARARIASRH